MGLIRMGPPTGLIAQLRTEFAIENFVETGTFRGDTAGWASRHFDKVVTIEYSRELYEAAVHRFRDADNIELIFGDSKIELRKLAEQLEGAKLFWLDAHWSGGSTYGEEDQTPLLGEISAINRSSTNDFILIDDARLFTSPPQPPHRVEQWPDIATVIDALRSGTSNRYIVIIEDVIIAVPNSARTTVARYCQEVNARSWEEYARQTGITNFRKGIELIHRNLKARLKPSASSMENLYRSARNRVRQKDR